MEGVASATWNRLCKSINFPAFILQSMQSAQQDSIQKIVEPIVGDAQRCFVNNERFYIVAHSFGSIIAIELARILEKSGHVGRILLIDGAPIYLKRLTHSMMQTISSHVSGSLENTLILTIFLKLCAVKRTEDFVKVLIEKQTWLSKVDLILEFLPSDVRSTYTDIYLSKIIQAILNRVKAISAYETAIGGGDNVADPRPKLKSNIILVRPSLASFKDIAEDYELSSLTEEPVTVRILNGDHLTMLDGNDIIDVINEYAP